MKDVLAIEMKTYAEKFDELRGDMGKFVLIKGPKIIGVFGTYEDAVNAGYEQFKLQAFLVKQINVAEQVQTVTRVLDIPCPI